MATRNTTPEVDWLALPLLKWMAKYTAVHEPTPGDRGISYKDVGDHLYKDCLGNQTTLELDSFGFEWHLGHFPWGYLLKVFEPGYPWVKRVNAAYFGYRAQ